MKKSDRNLYEIITQVFETLPDEHKPRFNSIRQSVIYAAPEAQGYWYQIFLEAFNDLVPNKLTEEWQVKAVAALTKMSEKEVRAKHWVVEL